MHMWASPPRASCCGPPVGLHRGHILQRQLHRALLPPRPCPCPASSRWQSGPPAARWHSLRSQHWPGLWGSPWTGFLCPADPFPIPQFPLLARRSLPVPVAADVGMSIPACTSWFAAEGQAAGRRRGRRRATLASAAPALAGSCVSRCILAPQRARARCEGGCHVFTWAPQH